MLSYINLGLRVVIGTIAGAVRLGPFVIQSLITGSGQNGREFPKAIELGAPLLRHVVNNGDDDKDYFTDITITTPDGIKLHAVVDNGQRRKNGKRAIVFVHGFPELWVSWYAQMEYFAKLGHPILALDMRGYGKSDKPASIGAYHIYECLVKDLNAVIEYTTTNLCGEKKPLLVAHDWGAAICWHYAFQKETVDKERIVGYVALAVPPGKAFEDNMTLKQLWASLYMAFFNMPWLPEKLFLYKNALFVGLIMNDVKRGRLPTWLTNAYRANCLQPGAMQAQFNYYRSALQQAPKPPNGSYGTKDNPMPLPTLILRGLEDSALGDDIFRNLDLYLKNNKLVAFKNCSHWIQWDCPNEVNSEIDAFLATL